MVKKPIIEDPEDYPHEILRLPGFRQPQEASECICYALWVSIQYVSNAYPDKQVRDRTNPQKIDNIKEYVDIGELGWENPSQTPLTKLSSEVSSLKFNLEYRYNGLSQDVDEVIDEGLNILLPTILFIDNQLIKTGERGTGPMHAVVACGFDDDNVTIVDPLVEGKKTIRADQLNGAWDPEFNTCVKIRLSEELEPVQREDI